MDSKYEIDETIIGRRGIYKDLFRSSQAHCDLQFRPNFAIAMTVAPELFSKEHALHSLEQAKQVLLGPMGMKKLDPQDPAYRGHYDNDNDGDDASIARGFNYHQGPEWFWPVGYFLRALVYFDSSEKPGAMAYLRTHQDHVKNSPWAGLPELTNENGAFCAHSCHTQAWSAGTILDFLYDIHQSGADSK